VRPSRILSIKFLRKIRGMRVPKGVEREEYGFERIRYNLIKHR